MADDDDLLPVIEEEPEPGVDVVMPSDLNAKARAPGGLIIRQLTEEERRRYPPERPTREDLLADREAGLNTLDIARKYGKSLACVEGVAKHYRIGIKTGRPDPERAALRKKIEEEMAAMKAAATGKEAGEVPASKNLGSVLTKEFLEAEIQQHSTAAIAKAVGCSTATIDYYLAKNKIPNPRGKTQQPAAVTAPAPAAPDHGVQANKMIETEPTPPTQEPPLPTWSGKARYHKLIDGMLDELPPPSEGWTPEGAAQWISLMNRVLVQVYRLSNSNSTPAA